MERITYSKLIEMSKTELVGLNSSLRVALGYQPHTIGKDLGQQIKRPYLDLISDYTTLYDRLTLLTRRRTRMAKARSKAKAEEKATVAEVTIERKTLAIMAEALWDKPEDRPDLELLDEDEILQEIIDNVSLVEPADKDFVLSQEDGEEVWNYLCGLRKELSGEQTEKADKKAKAKGDNGKAKAKSDKLPSGDLKEYAEGSSAQILIGIVKGAKKPIKLTDVVAKFAKMCEEGKANSKNPEGRAAHMLKEQIKRGLLVDKDGSLTYYKAV